MRHPWLMPGLRPEERAAKLHDHLDGIGWRADVREGSGRSMALPWGVVRIRVPRGVAVDTEAALLSHEATHARQMGRSTLGRWWWALCYLASPWARRRAEMEAEAHEAAMWAALRPSSSRSVSVLLAILEHTARALGGWRWPHLTGGDREAILRAVAIDALLILADAEGGDSAATTATPGAVPDDRG